MLIQLKFCRPRNVSQKFKKIKNLKNRRFFPSDSHFKVLLCKHISYSIQLLVGMRPDKGTSQYPSVAGELTNCMRCLGGERNKLNLQLE